MKTKEEIKFKLEELKLERENIRINKELHQSDVMKYIYFSKYTNEINKKIILLKWVINEN